MGKLIHPQSELIREPNLLIPGGQPIGPVKINRDHWFGKHIVFYQPCWGMSNIGGLDYHRNVTVNGTGHSTSVDDLNGVGRCVKQTTTSDYIDLGTDRIPMSEGDPITVLATMRLDVSVLYSGIFSAKLNDSVYRFVIMISSNSNYYLTFGLGITNRAIKFNYLRSIGVPFQAIFTNPNGLDVTYTDAGWGCWVNGVSRAAMYSPSFTSQSENGTYLGWDGADSKWQGAYKDIIVANCAINEIQAKSLYTDPRQFLIQA